MPLHNFIRRVILCEDGLRVYIAGLLAYFEDEATVTLSAADAAIVIHLSVGELLVVLMSVTRLSRH